jgi:hypothetical protein
MKDTNPDIVMRFGRGSNMNDKEIYHIPPSTSKKSEKIKNNTPPD